MRTLVPQSKRCASRDTASFRQSIDKKHRIGPRHEHRLLRYEHKDCLELPCHRCSGCIIHRGSGAGQLPADVDHAFIFAVNQVSVGLQGFDSRSKPSPAPTISFSSRCGWSRKPSLASRTMGWNEARKTSSSS